MAINKVSVVICGKTYNLVSEDPPEYVRNIALNVEDLIRRTGADFPGFNSNMINMLSLLKLQDEHTRRCAELSEAKQQLAQMDELEKENARLRKQADENVSLLTITRADDEISALKKRVAALELENAELRRSAGAAYETPGKLKGIG